MVRPSRRRVAMMAAQIAQDTALAALLGGNLFGRVAMHPSLANITDKGERGLVLNNAWKRYGNVESAALVLLVGGWVVARRDETGLLWTSPLRRRLITAKDVAVGAVVVTGLASAAGGVRFSHQAPEGAVPMQSGSEPAPETPPEAVGIKRALSALGALNLVADTALVAVNVVIARSVIRLKI